MSGSRIAGFTEDKLTADAEMEGAEIRARVSGTASQREVAALESFFGAIVREATARHDGPSGKVTVSLDLRDLRYMNSSHFKALVTMVGKIHKSGAPVLLRLLSNDAYHWQKRSLPALRHLAEDIVVIE